MTSLRFAADGTPCCCAFDAAGNPIPMTNPRNACDECQAHFAAQEERAATRYPVPDSYEPELKQLRAASATAPSFEDGWKERRTAELAAQRERMSAHLDALPLVPRLTAAEVHASYAPPDPYAKDLDKMRREGR